mmetsp:Transcript_14596/g.37243  ORF Transcript_14596/g.37243 Transcript_14596/m.37243 type:complete len:1765 (-) Transcript_14596:2208-7502(-)
MKTCFNFFWGVLLAFNLGCCSLDVLQLQEVPWSSMKSSDGNPASNLLRAISIARDQLNKTQELLLSRKLEFSLDDASCIHSLIDELSPPVTVGDMKLHWDEDADPAFDVEFSSNSNNYITRQGFATNNTNGGNASGLSSYRIRGKDFEPQVELSPTTLVFHRQEVYTTKVQSLILTNRSPSCKVTLRYILSVSDEVTILRKSEKDSISFNETMEFSVFFLPRKIGVKRYYLLLLTSAGDFAVELYAHATQTTYYGGPKPLAATLLRQDSLRAPIILRNPTNTTLVVHQAFSTSEIASIDIGTSSRDSLSIQSGQEQEVFIAIFSGNTDRLFEGFLHILTSHVNISLPFEIDIRQSAGLFVHERAIDFGIVSSQEEVSIPIHISNLRSEEFLLADISVEGLGKVVKADAVIRTIPPHSRKVKGAILTLHPEEEGYVTGRAIILYINSITREKVRDEMIVEGEIRFGKVMAVPGRNRIFGREWNQHGVVNEAIEIFCTNHIPCIIKGAMIEESCFVVRSIEEPKQAKDGWLVIVHVGQLCPAKSGMTRLMVFLPMNVVEIPLEIYCEELTFLSMGVSPPVEEYSVFSGVVPDASRTGKPKSNLALSALGTPLQPFLAGHVQPLVLVFKNDENTPLSVQTGKISIPYGRLCTWRLSGAKERILRSSLKSMESEECESTSLKLPVSIGEGKALILILLVRPEQKGELVGQVEFFHNRTHSIFPFRFRVIMRHMSLVTGWQAENSASIELNPYLPDSWRVNADDGARAVQRVSPYLPFLSKFHFSCQEEEIQCSATENLNRPLWKLGRRPESVELLNFEGKQSPYVHLHSNDSEEYYQVESEMQINLHSSQSGDQELVAIDSDEYASLFDNLPDVRTTFDIYILVLDKEIGWLRTKLVFSFDLVRMLWYPNEGRSFRAARGSRFPYVFEIFNPFSQPLVVKIVSECNVEPPMSDILHQRHRTVKSTSPCHAEEIDSYLWGQAVEVHLPAERPLNISIPLEGVPYSEDELNRVFYIISGSGHSESVCLSLLKRTSRLSFKQNHPSGQWQGVAPMSMSIVYDKFGWLEFSSLEFSHVSLFVRNDDSVSISLDNISVKPVGFAINKPWHRRIFGYYLFFVASLLGKPHVCDDNILTSLDCYLASLGFSMLRDAEHWSASIASRAKNIDLSAGAVFEIAVKLSYLSMSVSPEANHTLVLSIITSGEKVAVPVLVKDSHEVGSISRSLVHLEMFSILACIWVCSVAVGLMVGCCCMLLKHAAPEVARVKMVVMDKNDNIKSHRLSQTVQGPLQMDGGHSFGSIAMPVVVPEKQRRELVSNMNGGAQQQTVELEEMSKQGDGHDLFFADKGTTATSTQDVIAKPPIVRPLANPVSKNRDTHRTRVARQQPTERATSGTQVAYDQATEGGGSDLSKYNSRSLEAIAVDNEKERAEDRLTLRPKVIVDHVTDLNWRGRPRADVEISEELTPQKLAGDVGDHCKDGGSLARTMNLAPALIKGSETLQPDSSLKKRAYSDDCSKSSSPVSPIKHNSPALPIIDGNSTPPVASVQRESFRCSCPPGHCNCCSAVENLRKAEGNGIEPLASPRRAASAREASETVEKKSPCTPGSGRLTLEINDQGSPLCSGQKADVDELEAQEKKMMGFFDAGGLGSFGTSPGLLPHPLREDYASLFSSDSFPPHNSSSLTSVRSHFEEFPIFSESAGIKRRVQEERHVHSHSAWQEDKQQAKYHEEQQSFVLEEFPASDESLFSFMLPETGARDTFLQPPEMSNRESCD